MAKCIAIPCVTIKFAQNNVKSQTITQAPGVELSNWYQFY